MMRAVVGLALMVSASSSAAGEPQQEVPFVGCPRDGQAGLVGGPLKPPTNGVVPRLPRRIAGRVAFYWSEDIGILAPRGWHCVGLYGSGGFHLIVAPDAITANEFLRSEPKLLRGSAIEVGYSFGGTSGRTAVGTAIARYFPAKRDFIRKTNDLFEFDVFGALPSGPYPADRIHSRTGTLIRFSTPAWRDGAGTEWLLAPANRPIEGIRQLRDVDDGPNLLGINIRLPADLADLSATLLSSAQMPE